ncbi:MAG: dihydrolipoamide acetyltransferase family protein [Acidimicrobiales bacterium]|jgi:2-oxoglutarate dehydrogenase E2 component (dihydrolipoamide succinyltransferase)
MPDVTMPQLGETVAEGTVTKWFKSVGDEVEKGEALFEVSTDKVDTEIPAPASGVITAILVPEGDTVDVGTKLAVIGNPGDSPTTSTAQSTTALEPTPAVETPNVKDARKDSSSASAPLSPVVRRLLSEHGLDASQVVGTGPNGRITRSDVENAVSGTTTSASKLDGDEVIAFTKIRRLTAEHMVHSKATSAHTLMVKEVDYEAVEEVRRRYGKSFKELEGFSLSYLTFNALATVAALADFPRLNASVDGDNLVVHHHVNLGIAVDLDGEGLVVPVIAKAGGYNLRSMARTIRQLADGARNKKLTVDDMANGTFTISNPGPFDTLLTGAIINQPQVAILSTDGVTRKPVVVELGGVETIVVHSVGLLALTFDHRAVDGAYAARFLSRVDEILNTRDWALELEN